MKGEPYLVFLGSQAVILKPVTTKPDSLFLSCYTCNTRLNATSSCSWSQAASGEFTTGNVEFRLTMEKQMRENR